MTRFLQMSFLFRTFDKIKWYENVLKERKYTYTLTLCEVVPRYVAHLSFQQCTVIKELKK